MQQQDTLMKSVSSEESESLKESADNNVDDSCVPEPDLPASTEVSYLDNDSLLIEAKKGSNQNDVNEEYKPIDNELIEAKVGSNQNNVSEEYKPIDDDMNSNMNGDIDDSSHVTPDNNVHCEVIQSELINGSELPECGITSDHNNEDNGNEDIEVVASDIQCETTVTIEEVCEEYVASDDERNDIEEEIGDNLGNPLSSSVDSVETETKDLNLPGSSSECPPSKPLNVSDKENNLDINSENSYVPSPGQSSWGGKIRSVSARRPVRKPSVPPENLSERRSRSSTPCKVGISVYNVGSDHSAQVSENLFSSLKRKAFELDCSMSNKRQKINGSQSSTFFSMVSSPLRLLKNKISDRIIESSKDNEEENINGSNKEEHEECKINKGSEIKDQNVLTSENTNVDSKLTKSWCAVM